MPIRATRFLVPKESPNDNRRLFQRNVYESAGVMDKNRKPETTSHKHFFLLLTRVLTRQLIRQMTRLLTRWRKQSFCEIPVVKGLFII